MRRAVKVHGIAAALTSAIVALIVVVPTILVVGALLSETNRNARSIGTLIDAETWTRAIEARPRLSPILRAINERFDIPELVKAATSWLAGWSGSFVQGSFTGLISLMLMFYFLFYLLRDREEITRAVERHLAPQCSRIHDGERTASRTRSTRQCSGWRPFPSSRESWAEPCFGGLDCQHPSSGAC